MKLTDKRFWIVWAITELLILSSCIYLAVPNKAIVMIGFFISQPLMVTLTLYKRVHRNGAIVNCVIVCIYTAYYMYMHLTEADSNGWGWLCYMVVLPMIQLIILLLLWGMQKTAEIVSQRSKSAD